MSSRQISNTKASVRDHWDAEPCGTRGVGSGDREEFFRRIQEERYQWEPYIAEFARFAQSNGKRLLEIGVGAGTDFNNWIRHGANATGIDLTINALKLTRERLILGGYVPRVAAADAEELPFRSETFELVYAYGVIHHSPGTRSAVAEIHRVLKAGGQARIMIYHVPCWSGFMLWVLHCLLKGRPWRTPRWAIANHLESPGTKAYTLPEAHRLFSAFSEIRVTTQLGCGDLLLVRPSRKYTHWPQRALWVLYPRWFVKLLGNRLGIACLIEATK